MPQQHAQSRFLKVASPAPVALIEPPRIETPIASRFIAAHPRLSRFLAHAVLDPFLARHPRISRFISLHMPVLCPFLPLPTGAQNTRPGPEVPPPAPRPSGFISLNL